VTKSHVCDSNTYATVTTTTLLYICSFGSIMSALFLMTAPGATGVNPCGSWHGENESERLRAVNELPWNERSEGVARKERGRNSISR